MNDTSKLPPTPPGAFEEESQPAAQAPASVEVKQEASRKSGGKVFLWGFLGALVACVLALGGFVALNSTGILGSNGSVVLGSQSDTATSGSADENTTLAESVAEKCLPSVAAIDVYTEVQTGWGYYGYQSSGELQESSLGSGVVLTSDGYIITNYHVIEGADAVTVTVEGNQYDAEIVGSDPSSDIAVLKAEGAENLQAIEIGDSDDLTIGEWVMTIGSPFGLEQSVATGIISATSRSQIMSSDSYGYGADSGSVTIYPNMIQTDAAINPGNSGGALVDSDGKLIGINTLITSYSGNYSGVGFAIPVNYAVELAEQIIAGETPTHAQLGVSLSTVNDQVAQRYGFAVNSGAYVAAVNEGSGAAEAGLQVGDIITAFDGESVEGASDLMLDIRTKNPGDTVTLSVNRAGEQMEVEVTLGSDANSQSSSEPTQQESLFDLFQ